MVAHAKRDVKNKKLSHTLRKVMLPTKFFYLEH